MWWIIGIVAAVVIVIVVLVTKASGGYSGGGDTIKCPHCHRSIRKPARRWTGADIELYEFPCPKCRKMIYAKAGG